MAGSRKEYELLLKLSAALGGNFNTTFTNAINTTKKLQNTLSDVKKVQNDISGYKKTQDAITATKSRVDDLAKKHDSLQSELTQTISKEKELQAAVKQAKANQAAAKDVETYKKLTAEHDKLQKELEQTTNKKSNLERQITFNVTATANATKKIAEEEQKLSELNKELQAAGVNTNKLTQENEKLERAYERVKKSQESIARINQQIDENKTAISATKGELVKTIGIVGALGAALTVRIKGAMEFESSMAEVAKVVDWIGNGNDATAEQIKQYNELSDGLYKLTREIPLTVNEFAEITAAAGQANVALSNADLLKFAADAAKMGIAFDTTAEQAGDWMAKWRTSFSLTQAEVVTLSDKINYLGNNSAANAQQISEIVTKIGPLGEVAGFANGEIAALGATLVAVGVQEDVAATGIKKVMTTMTAGNAATKRQKAVLDQLGLSATDLAKRMQTDAQGAILDFMGAIKGLDKDTQAAALKNYFGEESVAAIAPMLTQLDLLQEHFNMVGEASQYAGSMEGEYAARAATSEYTMQTMKNALKELSDTFGKIFVPGAASGVEALTKMIYKVTDFVKENPELIKTLTKVAGGLAAVKIGGLSAKLGFLELKGGVLEIQKVFALFKGKLAETATDSLTGSGKIASMGKSLSGYFSGVKSALGDVDASVSKFDFAKNLMAKFDAGSLGQVVSGGMSGVVDNVLSPFKTIGGKVNGFLSPIGGKVTGFFGGIGNKVVNGPLGKIGGVFKSVGGVAGSVLGPAMNGLGSIFGGLFGKAMPIVLILSALSILFLKLRGEDISGFIEPLKEAFEQIKPVLQTAMEQFKVLGQKMLPLLINAAKELAPLLGQIVTAILPVVLKLIQSIVPLIIQLVEQLLPVILNLITELAPLIADIITAVLPILVQLLEMILPIITELVTAVLPIIVQVLNTLLPIIKQLIEAVLPVLMSLLQALMPVIQVLASIFGDVLGAAIKSVTDIIGGVMKILGGLIDFITGVFTGNWKQAWEGVKSIFGGIFETLGALVKTPINAVIGLINGAIKGINKLGVKIPDWVPVLGGKDFRINIPEMPMLEKGSNYTPDTFIAGDVNGKGGELITGAKGRKVFTAAQTGDIFKNINTLKGMVSARNPVSVNTPTVSVTASRSGGGINIKVESNPVIHVDGNTPNDLEEKLKAAYDYLIALIMERLRREKEDAGRVEYA